MGLSINHSSRLLAAFALLFGLLGPALVASPAAAQDYRAYASALVSQPPKGAVLRPDLEALLDELASRYREGKGRKPLMVGEELRDAARAQAIDMLKKGKSTHRSARGEGFDTRFAAFMGLAERFPARGENAASDRRKDEAGPDKARRLFQSWIESSSHRRNLLQRDYAYVSTGVVQRGSELWAVQIFWAEPLPEGEGQPSTLFSIE